MNDAPILVTGSQGLVGRAMCAALRGSGHLVRELDLAHPDAPGDILDEGRLAQATDGVAGIVHLAAVSRVVWGQSDPERCRLVNVGGTRQVLRAAQSSTKPWVLFASSREVYGNCTGVVATEAQPLSPTNVYAHTKVAGERLVSEARSQGLPAAIVRLSNVYGSALDHADRVVPAFCRAAATGGTLRVEGRERTFDFTHISDVVGGLLRVIDALAGGEHDLPPIHFVSGRATTLLGLAELANEVGGRQGRIVDGTPRQYDVPHFRGNPDRAHSLLGWRAHTPLREGVAALVRAFTDATSPLAAIARA